MILWVVRALLSFALGLAFFLALAVLLLTVGASNLFSGTFYARALNNQNFYERIYDEALTPEAMDGVRPHLADRLTLLTSEELAGLVQTVAPPEYLKGEMEANLELLDAFLDGESDSLAIYVDLGQPMDRLAPAIAAIVEPRISGEPGHVADPSSQDPARSPAVGAPGSLPETTQLTLDEYAAEIEVAMESGLTGGEVSTTVSNLTGLTEAEVLRIFDRSTDAIVANEAINLRYRESLNEARPLLREAFASGTTYDLLSAAMVAAGEPAIELALADTRSRLDEKGRLKLVPLLAEEVMGTSESELQAYLQASRDSLAVLISWGRALPLLTLALAIALAVTVFWGKKGALYRWLYLTLTVSGGALFAITLVAYLTAPAAVERGVVALLESTVGILPGLPPLLSDVAVAIASDLLGRMVWLSGVIALAGAALWVGGHLAKQYKMRNESYLPAGMTPESRGEGPTPGVHC